MPTPTELVKARLAMAREDLDEVYARLSDDLLPWAPREGMRTVHGQIAEIIATETMLLTWMREGRHISFKEAESESMGVDSLAGLRAVLDKTRQTTLAYIEQLGDAGLEEEAPFPERWFEALRLPSVPRKEAFASLAAHEWYHTGQLVSYMWARGDDPYKW